MSLEISLPRAPLALPITPLEEAVHLSRHLGGPRIFFKRDDLTGIGLGGNKLRKLSYLLGEALAQGADTVITTASAPSNFLRLTTAACRRLGLRPILVIRGQPAAVPNGNEFCYRLMGAEVHPVATTDPFADETLAQMQHLFRREEAAGHRPYQIHLATFSGPLATVGYVDGAAEIAGQAADLAVRFQRVYLAVGSGGTQAGLLLGFHALGLPWAVKGVSVNLPSATLQRMIHRNVLEAAELIGQTPSSELTSVVTDAYVGADYAIPSQAARAAVQLVAESEGVFLDPIYTGRAMAALIDDIRAGMYGPDDAVLFLHTGGTPNLFLHHQAFASP